MPSKTPEAVQIITTDDGSHSLYHPSLDETYHSVHGAIQESQHVFIEQGLIHYSHYNKKESINILEVGLGTGLNLLLSAIWAKAKGAVISYTALEPFPVPTGIVDVLNYPELMEETCWEKDFKMIHASPWNEWTPIGSTLSFSKNKTKLEDFFIPNEIYDIVYFDAFAPGKQPEVWAKANLDKLYQMISTNGILVTYCAQGQFKRNLQGAGFIVETLPGPPGKFEMVRGLKQS